MKKAAIIEARMSSSRLPGKVLAMHNDKPMIQIMVERLRDSLLLDDVIVATTVSENDNELCGFLESKNIPYFRGSEENVLERVLHTAKHFNIDLIVEVTGDCPLLDPTIVDQSIGYFFIADTDYVGNTCITSTYPRGQDVKVFTTDTLEDVNIRTNDPDDQEHVSLFIYNNRRLYTCTPLPAPKFDVNPGTRLTVDYPVDLEVVLSILEELGEKCSFRQIVDFLNENPHILEMNSNLDVDYINDDTRYGE
jgi:spore coat polysaccharide biosynthesis protein SpsF